MSQASELQFVARTFSTSERGFGRPTVFLDMPRRTCEKPSEVAASILAGRRPLMSLTIFGPSAGDFQWLLAFLLSSDGDSERQSAFEKASTPVKLVVGSEKLAANIQLLRSLSYYPGPVEVSVHVNVDSSHSIDYLALSEACRLTGHELDITFFGSVNTVVSASSSFFRVTEGVPVPRHRVWLNTDKTLDSNLLCSMHAERLGFGMSPETNLIQ